MEPGVLGDGPSYWQLGAALAAVLGLLVVVLKVLQRWQAHAPGADRARMLSVQRLGPKRELQVLQVGDEVHTIYRHEGAMVLLGTDSRAGHEAAAAARPRPATQPLVHRLRAMVAAAGSPRSVERS